MIFVLLDFGVPHVQIVYSHVMVTGHRLSHLTWSAVAADTVKTLWLPDVVQINWCTQYKWFVFHVHADMHMCMQCIICIVSIMCYCMYLVYSYVYIYIHTYYVSSSSFLQSIYPHWQKTKSQYGIFLCPVWPESQPNGTPKMHHEEHLLFMTKSTIVWRSNHVRSHSFVDEIVDLTWSKGIQ